MNELVRKYLIEKAKKSHPVDYTTLNRDCKLNLNFDNQVDRTKIGSILGDISVFEHENNRPLISAIVVGKDNLEQGDGFFSLCEELGLGNKKKLKEEDFGIKEMTKSFKYWAHNSNSENEKSITIKKIEEQKDIFLPNDKRDFISEMISQKEIGNAGELIILEKERTKLVSLNRMDLSLKVELQPDGSPFDILSFDSEGNIIYIEVKNTVGNENSPFFMSINEKNFAEANIGSYFIYRLYNYNSLINKADLIIIDISKTKLIFEPTHFIVNYGK